VSAAALRLTLTRLSAVLAHGFLLVVGVIILAFGIVDLFTMLALLSAVLTWLVLLPASRKAYAAHEYEEHRLDKRAVRRVGTAEGWARHRNARNRARDRRDLHLPKSHFDHVLAAFSTVVWALFYLFIANAAAIAAAAGA